jgi:hypothetical protein
MIVHVQLKNQMDFVQSLMTVNNLSTATTKAYQLFTIVQLEPFGTRKLKHALLDNVREEKELY